MSDTEDVHSDVAASSVSSENEAYERASLDETNISVDLELQNESAYDCGRGDSSSISSGTSERVCVPKSTSTSLPPSPGKHIEHGLTLKQIVLKGITSQMITAQAKLNSKQATAITVSNWIAVGTKSGLVLVFDVTQTLKWFLETSDILGKSSNESAEWMNAISALAFNSDHSRLLVGTARGHILEYDMKDGKLIRTLNDVHPPEAAILHLRFTDQSSLALLCDSGGNVFELRFKRTLGVRAVDTRCLFSGSRGEVCCMEPLRSNGLTSSIVQGLHPKWESTVVVALATLTKMLIVQIRPSTKVIHTQQLTGDAYGPPCLAWHFVLVQSQQRGRTVEPVLAFGRSQELHFYQLSVDDQHRLRCHPLLHFQLGFALRGVQWLDTRTLALLDSQRSVHVVDVKAKETVDQVDISSVDLVKSAPFFQGLATGGNVSQALAMVGTEAYYNAFVACAGQVLLLCPNSLRSLALRTWEERLDVLISQAKYEDALWLGLHMYNGKAKAMQGLKGSLEQRRLLVKQKEMSMLNEYVERVMVPLLSQTTPTAGPGKLKEVIKTVINVCISLEEQDELFEQIYPMVAHVESIRREFLEHLEPHFLSDSLQMVPPSVMQQFVAHFEDCVYLDRLEQCLCHVQVACLDLHQVLTLCHNQGLYHAYLYVHTRALNDYIIPLEELMKQLQQGIKLGQPYTEQDIKLGHVLLVYISCCMAGRAYPVGEIDSDMKVKVKHQIFTCLTCLHSKRAAEDEAPYPYLRTLLEFNTQELLNVLSLAFEESEFSGELGARRQQRVIDILIEIMIDSAQFSSDQICSLFTFIARHIGRNRSQSIHLDRTLFQQLLELVCSQSSKEIRVQSRYEERQQALLQLLQLEGQPLIDDQEEEKLLGQAHSAGFFRVCEYIYEKRRDWRRVFECYASDSSRHAEIFDYLRRVFNDSTLSADHLASMEKAVLEHTDLLVRLDAAEFAMFLSIHRPHLILEAVRQLESKPRDKYAFLQAVIELAQQDHLTLKHQVSHSLVNQFVELMAQFEPERVISYIRMMENPDYAHLLEMCRRLSLAEAASFILERQGNLTEAYNLLLDNLKQQISQLFQASSDPQPQFWKAFQAASQSVIDFCQRQSASMSETDRERVWLALLDELLLPQRSVKSAATEVQSAGVTSILSGLREVTQQVVTSVQGHVSLPRVLRRVIEDPETAGGNLADLRQLVMGLLDNYNYETTLLRISTHLLQGDVHGLLLQRYRSSKKGVALRVSRCSLCKTPLVSHHQNDSRTIAAFQCRHAFHRSCLAPNSSLCVICHQIPVAALPVEQDEMNESNNQAAPQTTFAESSQLSSIQLESVTKTRNMLSGHLKSDWAHSSIDDHADLSISIPPVF